jgi:hypothetical protein
VIPGLRPSPQILCFQRKEQLSLDWQHDSLRTLLRHAMNFLRVEVNLFRSNADFGFSFTVPPLDFDWLPRKYEYVRSRGYNPAAVSGFAGLTSMASLLRHNFQR